MELVWDYCIAISKKFIMALKRLILYLKELADSHFLRVHCTRKCCCLLNARQSHSNPLLSIPKNILQKKEQSDIDHLLGFKCEVMVINDENVNVVCPPGGKIVVFTELKTFAVVQEIGTVIDHEHKESGMEKNYIRRYEGKKEDNDVESRQENGGVVGQ
nr:peptidase M48 [Tanacetum cinerariifolium]